MTVRITQAQPPHPNPEVMRKRLHKHLDELLDLYQWDQAAHTSDFAWDAPKSYGEVRMVVRQGLL